MDLFTYGTLRAPALMAAVAGPGALDPINASLADHAIRPVRGNVVPCVIPQAGEVAEGLLWRGLTVAQHARLDLYELGFGYTFETVTIETIDGPRQARIYMPPPDIAAVEGGWSLADWEAEHLKPAVLAAQELFAHDPLPDAAALPAQWPMIEARAWSKVRATQAQTTTRFAPAQGDFTAAPVMPPVGQFFRFQRFSVSHRRFDGGRNQGLPREAFWGIDAAMVLPYDPVRDRVLLVEQARIGPHLRGDPNPWMLEPIAGIIDARETPREAALREAGEEAGLMDITLIEAGSYYISPGNTTDYFYAYLGLCDLPHDDAYLGGLDEEAEDLRLHPMSFDAALALADAGEIATGPALHLLYWLLRHRDDLRQTRG